MWLTAYIYEQGTEQKCYYRWGNHDLPTIIYEQGTKQNVVRDEEIITYIL